MSRAQRNNRRLLFPPPSVLSGAEREAQVSDFESLTQKAIGEGAFGEVYKVRHKVSRNMYAIKVVSKQKVIQSNLLPQIRREVRIMYSLNHPHIIKLHNHFEDEQNFYLILELATGGTIWQKLARYKTFDEATAAQYLREVILAVEYLHSMDPPIIHRDIKPENLLLDKPGREGRVKLADFGWSNFFNDDRTRMTYCGTLDYLAPEMINQRGHSTNLDIWNLGVLLYEFLTGAAPFQASNQAEMFDKILNVRLKFPNNFSPLARDLIVRLLKAEPDERLPLPEVLSHPWLTMHPPIRPTITQQLTKEALPCPLEGSNDPSEVQDDDPIKPFNENEYKVISQPEPQEEVKEETKVSTAQPSAYVQQITNLESELRQTRNENNQYKSQLEEKEAELERVKKRIQDLEGTLRKLEEDCEEKRLVEKQLKEQLAEKTSKIEELTLLQEDENKLYSEYEQLRGKCLEKETELSLLQTEIENMDRLTKEKQSQAAELEDEVERLKSEIDATKVKYSKAKSEMHDQLLQLTTEVEVLQQELQSKERDSTTGSMEQLLSFTQENLELLKNRSREESDLIRQYQEANERLIQLDNKYTELKLQYDRDLAELKRKSEREIREIELKAANTPTNNSGEDLTILKERIKESMNNQYKNKLLYEELQHLQNMIQRYEHSISFSQKQLQDLEYLTQADQQALERQERQIESYEIQIEDYKKKLNS